MEASIPVCNSWDKVLILANMLYTSYQGWGERERMGGTLLLFLMLFKKIPEREILEE